jgi:sulfate permease, SulP family
VYGLYTSVAAPLGGSPLVSAHLMQIATTSAAALLAGQAVVAYPAERRAEAIFLLATVSGRASASAWLGRGRGAPPRTGAE